MFAFNKAITAVKRVTYTGNRSSLSSGTVNFECYLEPLDAEMSAKSGVQWGKGFTVYLDSGNDVVVTDVITIGGVDYNVKGKRDYDQLVKHIELIVVIKE